MVATIISQLTCTTCISHLFPTLNLLFDSPATISYMVAILHHKNCLYTVPLVKLRGTAENCPVPPP